MLIELEKHLKIKEKTINIFLETGSANKFAIKLYEKLGYKIYNERKNYYGSKSINSPLFQDAILFVKSLNAIS
jgi:ribosomal protein S18 acetylase RimI-like enzyme